MINLFKKLFIVLVVLSLPLILIGCGGEQPPVVTYFFTPKTTEMTLIRGEQGTIEYETNLEDEVYFESYDEKIATVDENGVVTAVKTGTTSIYASCGGYDFEVSITVNPKPITYYHLTIYGFDEIETTKKGVALIYLLQQTYGSKMYPNFGNNSFHGYYTDKECTKELDLYTQLHEDMTIYPKLKEDKTKCDLMFSISNVLFKDDVLIVNDNISVLTPDYNNTTANKDVDYKDVFMVVVSFDYNQKAHFVTNTYLDGDKQNVVIPYNGFVILIPKANKEFDKLNEQLKVGTKIGFDRYSINVANRIYINPEYEKKDVEEINITTTSNFSTAYDYTNDKFLYQKNADVKAYPASTTKIITSLAAVKYASLDLKITVGDELDVMYEGSSPGTAGSKKGQVWTLRQLLYAMLLPSGNDSAYTIAAGVARSLPGNEDKPVRELLLIFNDLMNEVRDEVGAVNSNFMVPDGNSYYNADGSWHERLSNHYVTANDMVKFAIYALNCPGIAKVVSTPNISFKLENGSSYTFNNINNLIKPSSDYYYQYCIGVKTGTTTPAGQCLIFAAEVDGRVVIGAAMKSSNRHADALTILKAAFKN